MFSPFRIPTLVVLLLSAAPLAAQQPGVPVNGFPNYSERALHQLMNRARVDPQAELAPNCGAKCPDAACYGPKPPLGWSLELNRATRFHSDEQRILGYIAHDSKCAVVPNIDLLYPLACDGSPACGCVGGEPVCPTGGCTRWFQRASLFGSGAMYEIIASPSDPRSAYRLWLFEQTTSAQCAFSYTNGHRWAILTADGAVGAGISGPATADFTGGEAPAKIASGAHFPQRGAEIEFSANWYDAKAPRSASVVVDGVCRPLSLERGTSINGTWRTKLSGLENGCHSYYFAFTDSTGAIFTYPAVGSYVTGDDSCGDWSPRRSSSSCAPSSGRRRTVRR